MPPLPPLVDEHRAAQAFIKLLRVMAKLRDPDGGCPWDVEQDFATIAPYTIEEAYEVSDAIDRGELGELKEELGDLLLQVVFHGQMAGEAGAFTTGEVAETIAEKMIARHPHVFGAAEARTAEAQTDAWEAMKARERDARSNGVAGSALDGVALALPALMRAEKLQKRAARTGFDWTEPTQILDKLDEEIGEVKAAMASRDAAAIEDELGDLLFVCANLARRLKTDPEVALRRANDKFQRRFRAMEALARSRGLDFASLDLDEQEGLWQEAKANEAG